MKEALINKINNLDSTERDLLLRKIKLQFNEQETVVSEKPKRLVAYLKPKDSFQMSLLDTYLKDRLPGYMIPAKINTATNGTL